MYCPNTPVKGDFVVVGKFKILKASFFASGVLPPLKNALAADRIYLLLTA